MTSTDKYQIRPGDYGEADEWKIIEYLGRFGDSMIQHKLMEGDPDVIPGRELAQAIADLFNAGRTEKLSRVEYREMRMRYPQRAPRVGSVGEQWVEETRRQWSQLGGIDMTISELEFMVTRCIRPFGPQPVDALMVLAAYRVGFREGKASK